MPNIAKVPSFTSSPPPFESLSKKKRAFVQEYVQTGDALGSYLKMGYKDCPAARARAGKLLREMAPYLSKQLTEYIGGIEMAILGTKVTREIAEDGKNEAVRLNAAKELLVRSAPEVQQEQVVVHKHEGLSVQSIDERIATLSAQLGLNEQ